MSVPGPSRMATVAASSSQAPGMPMVLKAPAATNPMTTQGINRTRLAHDKVMVYQRPVQALQRGAPRNCGAIFVVPRGT